MRWPWKRARPIEPRPMVGRTQELQTGRGDPGGGLPRPARRGEGDDSEQAGGERACGARGRAVAGDVLPEGENVGVRERADGH